MPDVNDRTSFALDVGFRDEDEVPVVPTAATYRIDVFTMKSSVAVLTSTPISPLATDVVLQITKEQNTILVPARLTEPRTVTVEFDYGVGKHGTAEYEYTLINLRGVTG
jgi:hypothetical protein